MKDYDYDIRAALWVLDQKYGVQHLEKIDPAERFILKGSCGHYVMGRVTEKDFIGPSVMNSYLEVLETKFRLLASKPCPLCQQ